MNPVGGYVSFIFRAHTPWILLPMSTADTAFLHHFDVLIEPRIWKMEQAGGWKKWTPPQNRPTENGWSWTLEKRTLAIADSVESISQIPTRLVKRLRGGSFFFSLFFFHIILACLFHHCTVLSQTWLQVASFTLTLNYWPQSSPAGVEVQ